MSYRAFKRLLGETSLERKCRYLLGTVSLVLIFCSFWFYARQTEAIAYTQTANSGRLLIPTILRSEHDRKLFNREAMEEFQKQSEQNRKALEELQKRFEENRRAMDEFQAGSESKWSDAL